AQGLPDGRGRASRPPLKLLTPGVAGLVLVGSLLVFAGLHLLFIPLEFSSDEGDNLLGGWLVSQGQVVYRDFFSQHTPFGYIYAALFELLCGRNWVVHRHSVALLGLATLGYLLCRLVRNRDKTLFYAAALFAVLWPFYSFL